MRGINCTEVVGYYCEGEYTCERHSPEPSQAELDDSYVTAVFAGDEGADDCHCRACYAEEHPAPTYLDPERVKAVRETCIPCSGVTRTGYGPKLATPWLLRIDGKRWHRVYVMQWSNMGTPYVIIRGERHLLGTYDPRQALVLQGQSELAADYMRHLDRQIVSAR